jgi:hypothetical protein
MAVLRRRAAAGAAALLCAAALLRAAPALAAPTVHQVEAVFLFYFTQFVEWPPNAFPAPHSPIVIGVLGEDPFGAALDAAVGGERVNGRRVLVRRLQHLAGAIDCQIVYISASEAPRLAQILSTLKGHGILTVSSLDHFTRRGGMIRFVLIHQHVRLRINARAAGDAGLRLSSKLLGAAAPAAAGEG